MFWHEVGHDGFGVCPERGVFCPEESYAACVADVDCLIRT
jgi:hypothetical protein